MPRGPHAPSPNLLLERLAVGSEAAVPRGGRGTEGGKPQPPRGAEAQPLTRRGGFCPPWGGDPRVLPLRPRGFRGTALRNPCSRGPGGKAGAFGGVELGGGRQSPEGHKRRPEVPGQKSAHRVRSARGEGKNRTERGARVWELWAKGWGEAEGRKEGGRGVEKAGRTDRRTDGQGLVQRPRRGKRKRLPERSEGPGGGSPPGRYVCRCSRA